MKWSPDIIIATGIIFGVMGMRCAGINGELWALGLIAAGWVFGGAMTSLRQLRSPVKNND